MSPRPVRRRHLAGVVLAGIPFNVAQGAAFPYWVLYLHSDLHFPTALAGLVIGTEGLASLGGALVGGAFQDHFGPRRTAQLGAVIEAVAAASLVVARSPLAVAGCFVLFGMSTLRYPARSSALLAALPDDLSATTFFSWDFMGANTGFGLGIVVGALLIGAGDATVMRGLFAALAVTSALLAVTYELIPNQRMAREHLEHASYRAAMRSSLFWYVGAWGLLLSLASYSSFDAGVPALIGIELHASPHLIALGFLTNAVLIVAFQQPVRRLVHRLRWRRATMATAAIFGASWFILFGALWLRTEFELAVLVVSFAATFSLAEMLMAPLRTQLIAALAPEHLRGRFYGMSHFADGVAGLVGPSVAGAMIGAGLGFWWLPLVASSGAGAAWVSRKIFRTAPAELSERT